jgi:hypothetical protein
MNRFKKSSRIAIILVFVALAGSAGAVNVVKNESSEFNVRGRMQLMGVGQLVSDDVRDDMRLYLFLSQARLGFDGKFEGVGYEMNIAFGGEEIVKDKNSSLGLLDFNAEIPVLSEQVQLKLGQFKVPYSRERMTDDGELLFASRSIQNLAFRIGRDVGAAAYGHYNELYYAGGVFTGGGRDIPERFLPEDLGIPMLILRLGYDTGINNGFFNLKAKNLESLESTDPQMAVYVNGLYIQDSRIGHSTVLGVKTDEESLFLNENWNSFFSVAEKGELMQAGLDVVYQARLSSDTAFSAELEGNWGEYKSSLGKIDLFGGRTQAAYQTGHWTFATRYSAIRPDGDFNYQGTSITGTDLIHEVTPAVNYSLFKGVAKIILDFPVLIDVPVAIENGVGAYVLTEQPGQVTVTKVDATTGIAGGSIERQTVPESRLLFQLSF